LFFKKHFVIPFRITKKIAEEILLLEERRFNKSSNNISTNLILNVISYNNSLVDTHLLSILTTNEDILIRRANVLAHLPLPLNDNTLYLGNDGNQIVWKPVNGCVDNLFQLQRKSDK